MRTDYNYTGLLLLISSLSWSSAASRGGIPRSDVVCWTCPRHNDNDACNRWAPNLGCPLNNTVCQTVHMFNMQTKQSLTVEKKCMKPSMCTTDHIGCQTSDDGLSKICTSCCKGSLCNEEVAMDEDSALKLSVNVHKQFDQSNSNIHTPFWILIAILATLPFL